MTNHRRSLLLALVGVAGALLFLAGCSTDVPLTTLRPQSDVANNVQGLYVLIFWISAVIFVVVEGALIYATIRYRRRDDRMPAQTHGHRNLEIGWTVAPALILVAILVPTWQVIFDNADTPDDAMRIEVTGHQWWWEIRYLDLGVVTANEIHLPVDRPVGVTLRSKDVIHSFWVPQLTGKQDMVPGRVNSLWFTPNTTGVFQGQCVEFCGEAHAMMKFHVEVQDAAGFDAWVAGQKQAPAAPTAGLAATGAGLFISKGCLACHTIEGTPALGIIGPNLTHFGSRSTLGAGMMENTPEEVTRWLMDPNKVKRGNVMARDGAMYTNQALALQPDEIEALVAYLGSLR